VKIYIVFREGPCGDVSVYGVYSSMEAAKRDGEIDYPYWVETHEVQV
jgi:hypothetical protein